MSKPSKHHKLKCSMQVRAYMFGEKDQKVKDMLMIMDITDAFLFIKDKKPDNSALMHTHLVIAGQRKIFVNSYPEVENFENN